MGGRKVNEQNCLETNFPEIAKQWHPTKNPLTPDKVLPCSAKKVWWLCPNKCEYGCIHEYEQVIYSKTNGSGCPYCCDNAKQICYHQSLKFLHPEIADQWHPSKNPLTPDKVQPFSNKKVWWLCPNKCEHGCIHEYEQTICNKTNGRGCPYCCDYGATQLCYHQSLKFLHPEIADQWHPTKNPLTPDKVRPFSGNKAWWLCPNKCEYGCIHEYEQVISSKTKGHGCPYCCDYGATQLCYHQSLKFLHPEIADQWHPDNEIKPNEITPGSGVKVWWKCIKNNTHEWEAVIGSRCLLNSGCPHCYVRFSKISLHWLRYIKTKRDIQYGSMETGGEFRIPTTRYDADGYCEKTNTIYEFHGDLWHGNPQKYPKDAKNPITKTTFGELYEQTQTKKQKILELGYNYIEMWESDWQRAIKCVIVLQRLYRKKAIGSHAH